MKTECAKTVGKVAAEFPQSTRIFEKAGIDYCCGGKANLEQACAAAGIPVDNLMEQLEAAHGSTESVRDWAKAPLAALIRHIVSTHHAYVREEIPRIEKLAAKVISVHGSNHPELLHAQSIFAEVGREMTSHMMKEEQILFPYIVRLERAWLGESELPPAMFGTVRNPIRMMMLEHENAGNEMKELRELTGGFVPPENACISYRTLYRALAEFEADLHQHVHLENNILFPKAVKFEDDCVGTRV